MSAWSPRLKLLSTYLLLACMPVQAQQCRKNMLATAPAEHFITQQQYVLDQRTGLQWQRCAVGQQWHQNSCQGSAIAFNWMQAQQQARQGWRLPSVSELAGITELRCQQPAINLDIFPGTQTKDFWSGTEFASNTENAWMVNFYYGESHSNHKKQRALVRLVKTSAKPGNIAVNP